MRFALALALAAAFPLGARAQACTPDLVNFTPTPTLGWDAAEGQVDGYTLYWAWTGGSICCYAQLPCQIIPNDDSGGTYKICPGVDYSVAPQKYTNTKLEELSFFVKAYNASGESPEYSNEVRICMPDLKWWWP